MSTTRHASFVYLEPLPSPQRSEPASFWARSRGRRRVEPECRPPGRSARLPPRLRQRSRKRRAARLAAGRPPGLLGKGVALEQAMLRVDGHRLKAPVLLWGQRASGRTQQLCPQLPRSCPSDVQCALEALVFHRRVESDATCTSEGQLRRSCGHNC